MEPDLLKLPWATLITLASGYAGYYVANVGVRSHHQAIDVAFSTLVFGFFAAFAYELLSRAGVDILSRSIAAFGVTIVIGGLWSWFGRPALLAMLRFTKVSENNDLPNAWMELFAGRLHPPSQLSVKLKDGTWLKCDNLEAFNRKPNGPCIFGGSGDLLMYVTHQQGPNEDEFTECPAVDDAGWGAEITYIPQGEIVRVDIRRK